MRYAILIVIFLSLMSCSVVPVCKYVGESREEANAGCLVIYNNKILMVEESNGMISLPGGGKNSGEPAQCTAEREVWEETGIEVKANRKVETFEDGFQLFDCEVVGRQVMDGSARPWRLEIADIHWIGVGEFTGRKWRFPEQVGLIERYLSDRSQATVK